MPNDSERISVCWGYRSRISSLFLILSQISLVKLNQVYNGGSVQCWTVINTVFSCLCSRPGGEFYKNCGVQREVPDSQHSTPPNKSKHNSKDSWWLSIKPIPSCLRLSAVTLFPWFLWAGVSLSMFLDKQIRFLLKQAAAVPFDNNVIIQNKWFSSLMRALLWVTKTHPHSDICLILSSWTLSSAGKFTGFDWSSVLKSD